MQTSGIYKLKGVIQPYAWGGLDYIAGLTGLKSTAGGPQAEYWLGAHPNHSSIVEVHGEFKKLYNLLEEEPHLLGNAVNQQFGTLPYLLKVLDVRQMLSIQVHPDKASAEVAFERENRAGIPLTAPHRNYKDRNHKPELMVALSDFWLLHGFKPAAHLSATVAAIPELRFLTQTFNGGNYAALYKEVMAWEAEKVTEILQPLVDRILPLYKSGALQKDDPHFWAARAVETFCGDGQLDRGIFSIYFFNLVHVTKGQGLYQPAGLPHAYLEGQNIEIMANSDNVLRAGLTNKHVDVDELMKYVVFEPTEPAIIQPSETSTKVVYQSPAPEFEVSRLQLRAGETLSWQDAGPQIALLLEGAVDVGSTLNLQKGEAAFVGAGAAMRLHAHADTVLFIAAVPAVEKSAG